MAGEFILDDINYWVKAYAKFGIEVDGLTSPDYDCEQIDVPGLDEHIEQEFEHDAAHQKQQWIIRDRAYEAMGLMESDGPNIGLTGGLSEMYQSDARNKDSEEAFINLIKGNVDRVVSQLELSQIGIEAYAQDSKDMDAVAAMNDRKDNILEDNNFPDVNNKFIYDGIQFGSGYMSCDYGAIQDSPDLAMFISKLEEGNPLTPEEYEQFQQAVEGHIIEYVNTFEMVHYRGARGKESRSIHSPRHRWIHRVEQVSVAEARRNYPEYAESITPNSHDRLLEINPQAYFNDTLEDSVTVTTTWIKFPVQQTVPVAVLHQSEGQASLEQMDEEVPRFAIGRVVRITGIGVVDMDIDMNYHNRFPFVNWTYCDSFRHSKGIGIVKFGRDPIVVHNQLHNGMLKYFGTMLKGGGFVDERLGLTQEDLQGMTEPGTYIPVKVPDENNPDATIDKYVVRNQPPAFPTVYADLMRIESEAMDSAMNIPNVYKGQKSGTSGLQEQVLQSQADMTHNVTISTYKNSLWHLGVILFSNIQEYDRNPIQFTVTDRGSGKTRTSRLNYPTGYYPQPDGQGGQRFEPIIENELRGIMYKIRINTDTIVPQKESEKASFYTNFFMQTAPYINDPISRAWLRGMNQYGFRLQGIEKVLDEVEEVSQQQQQQQMQMQQEQMQYEKEDKARKFALEQEKNQIDRQENNQDFAIALKKLEMDMAEMKGQVRQQSKDNTNK